MKLSKKIYLTIDDGPSRYTDEIVDFLKDRNIPAIMFFRGENIAENENAALSAIRNGYIAANHSYSHRYFSSLKLEQAYNEISECEKLIETLYSRAGIDRKLKLFRFPYGDKGYPWTRLNTAFKKFSIKYRYIQEFLDDNRYDKIDIGNIQANLYYKWLLDDIDVFWTFDTNDWQLGKTDFGYAQLDTNLARLKDRPKDDIILMHDREDTPEHFFYIIEKLTDEGYRFGLPEIDGNIL